VTIFFFIKLSRSTLSLWLSFLSFFLSSLLTPSLWLYKKKFSSHSLWKISSHFLKFSSLEKNETTQIFLWKESKLWEKLLCQKKCFVSTTKKIGPSLVLKLESTSLIKLRMINLRNQQSLKNKI
jgi:hypothetical protein